MTDQAGEAIDQLVTLDIRSPAARGGFLRHLYAAARVLTGGQPISTAMADALLERVQPGDVVVLLTGAGYIPTMPKGESDGPPGAAALARVLHRGLGAVPVFAVEPHHADVMTAASIAAGVSVRNVEYALATGNGAGLVTSPDRQDEVDAWIDATLTRLAPSALIAIERLAPAVDGVVYAARGLPLSGPQQQNEGLTDISGLMTEAGRRGALTIGLGDHGNEAGFGAIRDTTLRVLDTGPTIATPVSADLVFPATNANWASYAIEAALAIRHRRPELMHPPEIEERMLHRIFQAGALEASRFSAELLIDGLDLQTSVSVVQILKNIVRKHLE